MPVSIAAFAELARTRPAVVGGSALHTGVHAHRLLLLKALWTRVHRQRASVDATVLRCFEESWAVLEQAERRRPDAVRDVLDYPTTGSWLAAALAAPAGPALDRHLSRLEALAVTAALRAGCPLDRTVTAPDGLLSLPGTGRLRTGTDRVRLRARGRVATLAPADARGSRGPHAVLLTTDPRAGLLAGAGRGWSGLRTLPGGRAVLDDLDPYRVPSGGVGRSACPAAERSERPGRFTPFSPLSRFGHSGRPGGPSADEFPAWASRWRAAHDLLARTDPGRAVEIQGAVRVVVPLASRGPRAEAVGATLRSAPGAVLTTPPTGARELAETLVHEVHHGKLAALHELVPLYRPGHTEVHRVGWRSDPRPIAGVLQGAYAHLALTDLWRRAATGGGLPTPWRSRAGQQFERFHDQVGGALAILLESDELTNAGREFAQQMRRHHASLGATPGTVG